MPSRRVKTEIRRNKLRARRELESQADLGWHRLEKRSTKCFRRWEPSSFVSSPNAGGTSRKIAARENRSGGRAISAIFHEHSIVALGFETMPAIYSTIWSDTEPRCNKTTSEILLWTRYFSRLEKLSAWTGTLQKSFPRVDFFYAWAWKILNMFVFMHCDCNCIICFYPSKFDNDRFLRQPTLTTTISDNSFINWRKTLVMTSTNEFFSIVKTAGVPQKFRMG